MELKEYGGCLPLERVKDNGTNPFADYKKGEFASGRAAILHACRTAGKSKIKLPLYLCPYVKEYLFNNGIDVEEYNIDNQFCPQTSQSIDAMLLWPRYYGLRHQNVQSTICNTWPSDQIIFDNTQALFAEPVEGSFNVYSLRKFVGVPDGAYLIGPGIEEIESICDYGISWAYLEMAMDSPNSAYSRFLDNDETLMNRLGMSRLTKEYIKCVDFDDIREKRARNSRVIDEILKEYNELSIKDDNDTICYPFLRKGNESLRKRLLEMNIYTSTWWKRMLTDERSNEFERYLTQNLIPIPMDQRYSEDIVRHIACIIADRCEGRI